MYTCVCVFDGASVYVYLTICVCVCVRYLSGRNSSSLSSFITTAALLATCLCAMRYGTILDKSSLLACSDGRRQKGV